MSLLSPLLFYNRMFCIARKQMRKCHELFSKDEGSREKLGNSPQKIGQDITQYLLKCSLMYIANYIFSFYTWKAYKRNYKPCLLSTYSTSKQWLTRPAGFLWGNKHVFPLPVSIAVLAGGAERGGRACRGGVSCCRGGSLPLGELGGYPERCWEGIRWSPADWWSSTQMWTNIQKPCPGSDAEGKIKEPVQMSCEGQGIFFSQSLSYLDMKETGQCRNLRKPLDWFLILPEVDCFFF